MAAYIEIYLLANKSKNCRQYVANFIDSTHTRFNLISSKGIFIVGVIEDLTDSQIHFGQFFRHSFIFHGSGNDVKNE